MSRRGDAESTPQDISVRDKILNGLTSGEVTPEQLADLKLSRPEFATDIEGALQDFEANKPNVADIETVEALPKEALPQQMPQPKSAEESAQVFEAQQDLVKPIKDAAESASVFTDVPTDLQVRRRNQEIIDSINLEAENEIDQNIIARQELAEEAQRRKLAGEY